VTAEPTPPGPAAPGSLALFALVALGGLLGGLARTGALELAGSDLGTPALLGVNVLGSGLLGLLVGAATPRVARWLRPFAGTGVLGGFTTYSAAMAMVAQLEAGGGWASAAGYLALSLAGCVLAAGLGLGLGVRVSRASRGAGVAGVSDGGARAPGTTDVSDGGTPGSPS